jgi:hypothetical protein
MDNIIDQQLLGKDQSTELSFQHTPHFKHAIQQSKVIASIIYIDLISSF